MVEIKNTISFDEYNAIIDKVVNDCFPNGEYSPANYEISLRTALLCAFAPDYDISDCDDNNALWERVTNEEAIALIDRIYDIDNGGKSSHFISNRIAYCIEDRIKNAIDYRIKIITSSPMSMADMALANLLDVFANKANEIDVNLFDKEDVNIVKQASESLVDGTAIETMVNTMLDKGYIAKPNRATRRSNIKHNKKSESK